MVFGTCLDEDDQDVQQTLPRFSHDMSETSKDTARNFRNAYRQVSCFVLYGGDTNHRPPPPQPLNKKAGKNVTPSCLVGAKGEGEGVKKEKPRRGTWVFFWVGMCHPGLQIGTPF